jgi:hypothetical protein
MGTAMQTMPRTAYSTSLGAWKLSRQKETEKVGKKQRGGKSYIQPFVSTKLCAQQRGNA